MLKSRRLSAILLLLVSLFQTVSLAQARRATIVVGGDIGEHRDFLGRANQFAKLLRSFNVQSEVFTGSPDYLSYLSAAASKDDVFVYCGHGGADTGGLTCIGANGQAAYVSPEDISKWHFKAGCLVAYIDACGSAGRVAAERYLPDDVAQRRIWNTASVYVSLGCRYLAGDHAYETLRWHLKGKSLYESLVLSQRETIVVRGTWEGTRFTSRSKGLRKPKSPSPTAPAWMREGGSTEQVDAIENYASPLSGRPWFLRYRQDSHGFTPLDAVIVTR